MVVAPENTAQDGGELELKLFGELGIRLAVAKGMICVSLFGNKATARTDHA